MASKKDLPAKKSPKGGRPRQELVHVSAQVEDVMAKKKDLPSKKDVKGGYKVKQQIHGLRRRGAGGRNCNGDSLAIG